MIEVKKFRDEDRVLWNEFLSKSRSPIFLFSRNFMEYHKDRFTDHSLLVFDDGRLSAIMPASERSDQLTSHGGLTFGGFLVAKDESARNTLRYMSALFGHCHANGMTTVLFKQSPSFYSSVSQDDTDYGLFLMGAQLLRMDTAFAIDQRLSVPVPYQERRRRSVKKAQKNGIGIRETSEFSLFWNRVLIPNLLERFGVRPVHTLEEIERLRDDNPGSIRLLEAWQHEELMAGCVIFETPIVAHAQYISASDEGRRNGAIDLLFHTLITETFKHKQVFDFGIANEEEGRRFNTGLLDWKEGFGARAYAHRFYLVDTSRHALIDHALRND
jgi:hypothetical protein